MLSSRARLILAALLLVPVLLYWGVGHAPMEPHVGTLSPAAADTDFYLRDARIRQFDAQGQLHQELESPSLEHYPEPGMLAAATPKIQLFRDNAADRIEIEAGRGQMLDSNDRIELHDAVRVTDTPEGAPPLHLETDALTVLPDRQYAETDQLVTLKGNGGETRGRGMKAYLNERKVELLSDVEGHYEGK